MKHKMTELVLRCFQARTNAHLLHFATRSYSQHVALEAFYTGLVEHVDELVEVYQGDYGLLQWPEKLNSSMNADPLSLVRGLGDWIAAHRAECCDADDTYMQNIIDEIMALIRRTQYKLENLK